jgi:hypothetical protein
MDGMGINTYRFKSRIVELENEELKDDERRGTILCVLILSIVVSITAVKDLASYYSELIGYAVFFAGLTVMILGVMSVISPKRSLSDAGILSAVGISMTAVTIAMMML